METTVIFDLDGVLVDSRAAIAGCMNHALDRARAARPARGRLAPLHRPADLALVRRAARAGAGGPRGGRDDRAYRERYATVSLTATTVEPGMPEALDRLAGDHRLAVATSKPTAFAEPLLDAVGLSAYFEVIAGPGLDERAEPKTETLARGARSGSGRRAP